MKTVTIEQVENGFIVRCGDQRFIANQVIPDPYAISGGVFVSAVLAEIFEAPDPAIDQRA